VQQGGKRAGVRGPIVVLTGAGISVESGLPSFRGADGLWQGWHLEDVATPEAFGRDPARVQRFYDERRRQLVSAVLAAPAQGRRDGRE
jgi:NAD-dependent deacetylase